MSQTIDTSQWARKAASMVGALGVTAALFVLVVPLSHWLAKDPATIQSTPLQTVNLAPPPPPPPPPELQAAAMENASDASAAAPRPLGAPIELEALPTNSPALSGFVTGLLDVEKFPVEMTGLDEIPIFEVVDLDKKPARIYTPPNNKPYELQRDGISGRVLLQILISPQGHVSVTEVVSYDHERLVKYARSFAEKCRFESPLHNNQPVTATYLFPIEF
ncbi:energy transducer TonB [Cerasicoccus frondis]|uniref:energy transducer TonB n=1 Tax=Cerasicoccus frondis TaxID=490090 RepID=UPI002852B3F3|nr:energy transducer TonB [Cerasicoccus frondis]